MKKPDIQCENRITSYSVTNAINYIDIHYKEKITLEYLAETGHMASSAFLRLLKKETEIPPGNYYILPS